MNKKLICIGLRTVNSFIALLCIAFGILGIKDHLWHLLVIGSILLILSVFWSQFTRSSYPLGKIVRFVLVSIILLYATLDLGLILAGARAARFNPSSNTLKTMLILGTDTKGEQPGDLLKLRLDTAIEYLSTFEETKVIVSGMGRGEYTEGEVMRNYLIAHNIDSTRIFLESKAQSTLENFIFSQELAKREGLPDRFLVVTNAYHQFRASIYAQELGIITEPLSSPTTWYMLFPLSERERYLIVTRWLGFSPDLINKYQVL